MMRAISSVARRRSAAFKTLSGTVMGLSLPGSVCSRWRRERYIFRWRCGGNHGSSESDRADSPSVM